MTLNERIGQLCMIGIEGPEVTPDLRAWMKEFQPGGVIVFSRNLIHAEQIAQLTNELQTIAGDTPLLIAIDQEGGRVSRLPPDFTIFPPASLIATSGSTELAYQAAAVTAKELRAVGINMNMAPVLDVHTNPANPIIGDRAFGTDPEQVSRMGAATIAGLHDHLVLACGKHFPGHGDTMKDSHLELPVVTATRERLETVELAPFRHAIDHGLQAIMTAHVHYPALDPTNPATLSYPILSQMLRQRMGFEGLIFSDDLEMRAILDHSSIGDAAVRSLQAGVDILLICKTRDLETQAIEAVRQAMTSRDLSSAELEARLARLQRVKQRFAYPYTPVNPRQLHTQVGISTHRALLAHIQDQARAVT
ncbi:MAG: beta-N-acetylhexosaminidase [Nitrospirales bacterium]|nr:beta-N-acetylhexosaminidase [Nitrospira sp.]MCB9710352.1 beta-N-acetylhexosaminidase [Nitrospiraceae bacterium]MDR4488855.1 beta-N-acetylhexosaminidase [Nitrospirales bacterium]